MTKEDIARQRAEMARRPRLHIHGSETFTVLVLLVVLKMTGALHTSWLGTAGYMAGWIIGEIIFAYIFNMGARSRS